MSERPASSPSFAAEPSAALTRTPAFEARLKRRYAAERRFRFFGLAAILFSLSVLLFLLVTMTLNGIGGFQRTTMTVPIRFTQTQLSLSRGDGNEGAAIRSLEDQGLPEILRANAEQALGEDAADQLSPDAWRTVAEHVIDDPGMLDRDVQLHLPTSKNLSAAYRGDSRPELQPLAQRLREQGVLANRFDPGFLARSDASDSQLAGIWGALKGSILTMLVTLALAFPIGVLAALYLEEYAPRNRWTDLIEVSINNLAAVPSIIFGLLGLAVFLTLFPNLRSAPVIGGMTLALMTMPVIVISGRNAVKAVPPSIRAGAMALGASPVQVVFHHVLPLALPGILTGTIIGMARALGETAPLLMIGMRAFVATPPDGFTDPATVLPVQIFLWSDEIDRGFVERTSAAIIVLLVFLLVMNGIAIYLRNRFEKTW
jgi:phosphate transport system permease protein